MSFVLINLFFSIISCFVVVYGQHCNSGYYGSNSGSCVRCPNGMTTRAFDSNTHIWNCECIQCYSGSYNVAFFGWMFEDVKCGMSYYNDNSPPVFGTEISNCQRCPKNTYYDASDHRCRPCDRGIPELVGKTYSALHFYGGHMGASECYCYAPGVNIWGRCEGCALNEYRVQFESSINVQSRIGSQQFSYKYQAVRCDNCPPNMITDGGDKIQVGDCFCRPGYYSLSNIWQGCNPCPKDSYTPLNSEKCVSCGVGGYTDTDRSSGVDSCKCIDGYGRGNADSICVICPVGTYDDSSTVMCTQCPAHSHSSNIGSLTCVCNAGYVNYDKYTGCVACLSGKFQSGDNCVSCPSNAMSTAASTYCTCNSGCVASSSQVTTEDCRCCVDDSYAYHNSCVACPSNSNSPSRSIDIDNCQCNTGYATLPEMPIDGNGFVCVWCEAGTYVNGSSCRECEGPNEISPAGSTNSAQCTCIENTFIQNGKCTLCPMDMSAPAGSESIDNCMCSSGCARTIDLKCDCCHSDTYVNNNLCASCPLHSSSPALSTHIGECVCNVGFFPWNRQCEPCINETFTMMEGYSVLHSSQYKECGDWGEMSKMCAMTQFCKCIEENMVIQSLESISSNFFGELEFSDFICDVCQENMYRQDSLETCAEAILGADCDPWILKRDICVPCADNEMSMAGSIGRLSCVCLPGYIRSSSGHCLPCPENTYASAYDTECIACARGTYSFPPADNINSCLCLSGHAGPIGGPCVLCNDGKYVDNNTCSNCPVHSQWPSTASLLSLDDCKCNVGYWMDSASRECVKCPDQSTSALGSVSEKDCNCIPGSVPILNNCVQCSSGKYHNDNDCVVCPNFSTSDAGATECTCLLGYAGEHGNCHECDRGYYIENKECVECPAGANVSWVVWPPTHKYNCVCREGYGSSFYYDLYNVNGWSLHYKDNRIVIYEYPTYPISTSWVSACVECPVGTYSEYPGNPIGIYKFLDYYKRENVRYRDTCVACPWQTNLYVHWQMEKILDSPPVYWQISSPKGSRYQTDCYCQAGHSYTASPQVSCTFCAQGKYDTYVQTGVHTCTTCPPNTTNYDWVVENQQMVKTVELRDSVEKCYCNAGYTGPPGGPCEICRPDQYFATNAKGQNCGTCALGAVVNAARTGCTCNSGFDGDGTLACYCALGTEGPVGGPCNLCPDGKYGRGETPQTRTCVDCADGAVSTADRKSCVCAYNTKGDGTVECCKSTVLNCSCPPGSYRKPSTGHLCENCEYNIGAGIYTGRGLTSVIEPGHTFATSCVSCGLGMYAYTIWDYNYHPHDIINHNPIVHECRNCPSGKFQNKNIPNCENCETCTDCPVPSPYTPEKSTACATCAPGKYFNNIHQSECQSCPAGKYSQNSTCYSCAAGKYSESGKTTCSNCPLNTYSAVESHKCFDCGIFGYTLAEGLPCICYAGSTLLKTLEIRYWCVIEKTCAVGSCVQCSEGTFKASVGTEACVKCPVNYFTFVTGDTECTQCGPGTFTDNTTRSNYCETCPNGKYRLQSMLSCMDCSPGSYKDSLYDVVAKKNVPECKVCAAGSVASNFGMTSCLECGFGTIAPTTNMTTCIPCGVGQVWIDAKTCMTCGPGYAVIDNTCQACAMGKTTAISFTGNLHGTECVSCEAGKKWTSNREPCTTCAPGTFSVVENVLQCMQCAVGSFSNISGATHCHQCMLGYYARTIPTVPFEASECVACPSGTYSNLPSNSVDFCIPCPSNSLSGEGSDRCVECMEGTFANLTSLECEKCPDNWVLLTNSLSCEPCPPGTIVSASLSFCVPCPVGFFSSSIETCAMCPPGTYADQPGLSECVECDKSLVALGYGNTMCVPCTEGVPSADHMTCTTCSPGTYHDIGKGECVKCAPGKFQSLSGETNCAMCDVGSFSSSEGSVTCENCPLFQSTSGKGKTVCMCDIGMQPRSAVYSDQVQTQDSILLSSMSEKCEMCIDGYYKDSVSDTSCKECKLPSIWVSRSACLCPVGTNCKESDPVSTYTSTGHRIQVCIVWTLMCVLMSVHKYVQHNT